MADNQTQQNKSVAKKNRSPSSVSIAAEYHGPLPMASEFAAYERVQKGAADRIIRMAEKSLDAEIFTIRTDKITELVSMLLGKCFLYVLLWVSVYFVMNGKSIEGLLAGLAPIVSVVYATFKQSETDSKPKK